MNIHKARYCIGLLVLIGHFTSIGYFLYLVQAKFPDPELAIYLDGVAALLPFTLLYATVFYRYVVANPTASKAASSQPIGWAPFLVQFTVVALFIAAIHLVLTWGFDDINRLGGVQNIGTAIAGVDTVFAVFVSMTFSTLFPLEWEASKAAVASGAPAE